MTSRSFLSALFAFCLHCAIGLSFVEFAVNSILAENPAAPAMKVNRLTPAVAGNPIELDGPLSFHNTGDITATIANFGLVIGTNVEAHSSVLDALAANSGTVNLSSLTLTLPAGFVTTGGSYSNPSWITGLAWSKVTSTPTTLSGYGITNGVPNTTTVNGHALNANVAVSASDITTGVLAVANGGTGTATPGLVQGSNITITGSWPNQTIGASGGGGGYSQISIDGNSNLAITGNDSGSPADVIGFSATGVASVTAVADSTQIPITRTVGTAQIDLTNGGFGTEIAITSSGTFNASVTGAVEGDAISVSYVSTGGDGTMPGWPSEPNEGGLVIVNQWIVAGVVYVQVGNTDMINSYILNGYIYVRITR